MVQRKALGKGLEALIPGMGEEKAAKSEGLLQVALDEIHPSPLQPRRLFDREKIEELANSIRENGIIQPLIVKKGVDGFELIAGERRWRAAQRAGIEKVPVIVREDEEKNRLFLSLIENIQREDLNPLEEADAFQQIIERFGYTQEEIGTRVGKSRASVTNTLRLLKLHKKIKDDLTQNKINMGHARAYLGLDSSAQQLEAHARVLKGSLSVRQTENLVKRMKRSGKEKPASKKENQYEFVLTELRKRLGTKVAINTRGKRGQLIIDFYSSEELERIFELIRGR